MKTPWNLTSSIFSTNGSARSSGGTKSKSNQAAIEAASYWNDAGIAAQAMSHDLRTCMQVAGFSRFFDQSKRSYMNKKAKGKIMKLLKDNYRIVCNYYRFYSSIMSNGIEYSCMERQELTELLKDVGIIPRFSKKGRDAFTSQDVDIVVYSVVHNAGIPRAKMTKAQYRMAHESLPKLGFDWGKSVCHSMPRHKFLEVLLRIAYQKYVKTKQMRNLFDATKRLFDEYLLPLHSSEEVLDPDNFRNKRMYVESVDKTLRPFVPMLHDIFLRYAGKHPGSSFQGGEKGSRMIASEYHAFLKTLNVFSPFFTTREANIIFRMSIKEVPNLARDWRKEMTLDFYAFLEIICRLADAIYIPADDEVKACGANSIEEFYITMNATKMWDEVCANSANRHAAKCTTNLRVWESRGNLSKKNGDSEKFHYDSRPLSYKLSQILRLIAAQEESWNHRLIVGDRQDDSLRNKSSDSANFETNVASQLHELWRSARPVVGANPDGTVRYEPRPKTVHNHTYDIANLAFDALPSMFQFENLMAAHAACESIRAAYREHVSKKTWGASSDEGNKIRAQFLRYLKSEAFTEIGGEFQHICWLKRNGDHDWVSDVQRLPYAELPESEKEKDRVIVRAAVDEFVINNS